MDPLDPVEKLDPKVDLVNQDLQVPLEQLDDLDLGERVDNVDSLVKLDLLELPDLQDLVDQLDLVDHKVDLDLRDLLVSHI